jgi:hypothetical protein
MPELKEMLKKDFPDPITVLPHHIKSRLQSL